MNQYPLWKYLLIGTVIFSCVLYALPNLFGEDPSVQISPAYARNMKIDQAIRQDEDAYINELRTLLREKKLRYKGINRVIDEKGGLQVTFAVTETRDKAKKLIERRYTDLVITEDERGEEFRLHLTFSEPAIKERRQKALEQNITTLRNRVNELGVSEPIIQRQGDERIVVQLPGVQDTARAKEILGATATLEFRMLAADDDQYGGRLYKRRDGPPVTLKRSLIVTGDQIIDAAATIDQRTGRPAATVRLDSKGARSMLQTTRKNVGKPMAVVFIEYHIETKLVDGKEVTVRDKREEVINVATIQEEFSSRFQITGLTSSEANNLALLLRAGALKAPMEIIEERTIGPSLGKENINQGLISIMLGFLLVMLFMWMRYKTFGMIANLALLMNVIILVALLSLLQATLTLPGMAGIVLTLGMAVDANVLIFEKIREEIANKNSPQNSIYTGYEKAFITIFDANITTLIAALMLFGFGTGPIKGFAITLSLGIITSMFTAIMVSRGVINFFYGSRKLEKLPV